MAEIKPHFDKGYNYDKYIGPDSEGKLRCEEGYELIQKDENTFECTGGGHRYRFDDGTIVIDKFGNVLLKRQSQND